MENPEMDETEHGGDWKEKYFKVLMEHDDAEKAGVERFALLYKELLKSFKHFRGRDEGLDQSIAKLPSHSTAHEVPIETLKDLNRQIANILDLLDEDSPKTEQDDAESSSQDHFAAAKGLLEYFIEQLPSDVSNRLDSKSLSRSLEQASDINLLHGIADNIKNALSGVLNDRSKKIVELSTFLGGVAVRLDSLQSHLKEEQAGRRNSTDDRGELSEMVGNNLEHIRTSVAEAENIEVLQKVIDSSLDEVGSKVATFVEAESQRADKAEQSSAALEAQLQKLQTQTGELRESLEVALNDAIIDPLTLIFNRRAYDERFQKEYLRWQKEGEPLTLAIMDIDRFKNINDTFGHPVGDRVLKVVAERIQKQVRETDFFGRIGGEEFAFILVNSDIEPSIEKVEILRKSIETCKFSLNDKTFQVTLSIGLATFNNEDTIETIYSRADAALVKAKQAGRNKTLSELDL